MVEPWARLMSRGALGETAALHANCVSLHCNFACCIVCCTVYQRDRSCWQDLQVTYGYVALITVLALQLRLLVWTALGRGAPRGASYRT